MSALWGIFPHLPPVKRWKPVLGLVRRAERFGSPGASSGRRGKAEKLAAKSDRRRKRLAEGLCEKCGKPREERAKTRCEACLAKNRPSARKSAAARKEGV